MARRVKDANLETREARTRLKVRGKPYWRAIEKGTHVGYRRLKGKPGTWWARFYAGNKDYVVEALGAADDLSDADGIAILAFWQAVEVARERRKLRAYTAAGKPIGPLTVRAIFEDYLAFVETNRRGGSYDARKRAERSIYPTLGDIEVAALTADQLRKWHADLAKTRTRRGPAFNGDDADHVRRRKASANRVLTILRSALNRAWRDGKVPSDAAWRQVRPFTGVGIARTRYLSVAEAQRLVNAAATDFRPLAQAGLVSGCRYGELCRLRVSDFNVDAGTLAIRESKSGKSRHVILTDEGCDFFRQLAAGRAGDELMLAHDDGSPWKKSDQQLPMTTACARAKIKPRATFHTLRHTWASLAVMGGVPLMVVARNLGHSSTKMVEQHYGHLAQSYVVDAIRAGGPKFGIASSSNVKAIR